MFNLLKSPTVLTISLFTMVACSKGTGSDSLHSPLGLAVSAESLALSPTGSLVHGFAPTIADGVAGPIFAGAKIQPASFVTIKRSLDFQSAPETQRSAEDVSNNDQMIVGDEDMVQPIITEGPREDTSTTSTERKRMVPVIARTVEYRSVVSPRHRWTPGTLYGTTFGQHPFAAR